jgi:hypothetical protein
MSTLRTADGYEFETTRSGREVRCDCRKDGLEVYVVFGAAPGREVEIPQERIELFAATTWRAVAWLQRRRPIDED